MLHHVSVSVEYIDRKSLIKFTWSLHPKFTKKCPKWRNALCFCYWWSTVRHNELSCLLSLTLCSLTSVLFLESLPLPLTELKSKIFLHCSFPEARLIIPYPITVSHEASRNFVSLGRSGSGSKPKLFQLWHLGQDRSWNYVCKIFICQSQMAMCSVHWWFRYRTNETGLESSRSWAAFSSR